MAGYEVVIDKIAAAADSAQRVADVMGPLDFAGAVPDGDSGMPGARALAKLESVKRGWADKVKPLAAGFAGYADELTRAAEFYRTHEDTAEHDLRRLEMPRGAG